MKHLTTLEKVVTVFIVVLVSLLGLISVEAVSLDWTPAVFLMWVLSVSFVILIIIALNDERALRASIKDNDTIRKTIVLTKFEAHEIQPQEVDYVLMICNSSHKNMNQSTCKQCNHSGLHPKTPLCTHFNCEHAVRITG